MDSAPSPEPERKRSTLLSPLGVGALALAGVGTFAVTNGFGLAGRPCLERRVVSNVAECEALIPGPACRSAFLSGASTLGLSRSAGGGWNHERVTAGTDGQYRTVSGAAFPLTTNCNRSSSSRSYYWGGGSYGGTGGSSSSTAQSSTQRSGFGATASSFFRSSGG